VKNRNTNKDFLTAWALPEQWKWQRSVQRCRCGRCVRPTAGKSVRWPQQILRQRRWSNRGFLPPFQRRPWRNFRSIRKCHLRPSPFKRTISNTTFYFYDMLTLFKNLLFYLFLYFSPKNDKRFIVERYLHHDRKKWGEDHFYKNQYSWSNSFDWKSGRFFIHR